MVQYNMNVFSSGKVLPVYTAANVHVAKDPCNTELPYQLWDPMYVLCLELCELCVHCLLHFCNYILSGKPLV